MSNKNLARRTVPKIVFDGVDVTDSIKPYLLSMTYTDNEESESDDLQVKLQDRDGVWLDKWLTKIVKATPGTKVEDAKSSKVKTLGFAIKASIVQKNWKGDGKDRRLKCGEFEVDTVNHSGPPSTVTIKAVALPYSTQIRQTKKTKAWESYRLSGIAKEMAKANKMSCMFLCEDDPKYDRVEQNKTSDINFLSKLCKDAGISLKVTNKSIVLFDQSIYESKKPVLTIKHGDGSYIKWRLDTSTADKQYASCRVSYTDPNTGKCISGIAKVEDYDKESTTNQRLEIKAKVSSKEQAKKLAAKRLRLHNKFARTVSFTMPGNRKLLSGSTIKLVNWGMWDGKYIISQAVHKVDHSGYTTQITARSTLEGY